MYPISGNVNHLSGGATSHLLSFDNNKVLKIMYIKISGCYSKLIVAYLTPFLIISKIGCPFPLSLRRRERSLTVDRLQ